MTTRIEREEIDRENEPAASERQRVALFRWGVPREREEDPGLSRQPTSQWLGALVAEKRRSSARPRSEAEGHVASRPEPGGSGVAAPEAEAEPSRAGSAASDEPQGLEMELTAPTGVPYSTVRVRGGASQRPGEGLESVADRLTGGLTGIARREVARVAVALPERESGKGGAPEPVRAR